MDVPDKAPVAALYLRLSKEDLDKIDKGDDSESIKNQRLLLTEEAHRRGFLVGEIYSDEDYSGTDHHRPAFHRLIADAKEKKFDVILCKSQSRFTRDLEQSEKYINRIFPLLGIRFIGLVDHVDTSQKSCKKALQLNALLNEWYVEDLSENIRQVFQSKMRQGQYLGAFAAYGYQKSPDDHHQLVIDTEAATVVQKIFRYYLEGYGIPAICAKLQEENILTPAAYKKKNGLPYHLPHASCQDKNPTQWSPSTIKRILTNEVYLGTLIQGRERRISYKCKKVVPVPREEWIICPQNHAPIISAETFFQVQALLKQRRKRTKSCDKTQSSSPLAGLVHCKDCGSTMVKSGTKGKNQTYLRCSLASSTACGSCTGHSIASLALEEQVCQALNEQLLFLKQPDGSFLFGEDAKTVSPFPVLTFSLAHHFISSIEIGEKKENNRQEIWIHWNF